MSGRLEDLENRLPAIDTGVAVVMVMVSGLYALIAPGVWRPVRIACKTGALVQERGHSSRRPAG